jgi:hypothetical protein
VTFNYARSKETADRLIQKFGQTGLIRRRTTTGPEYDPTEGDPTDHACRFAVMDYSNAEIDGSRILATDRKVYLAKGALTIEPGLDDLLVDSAGVEYRIIPPLKPLNPGGVVVFWELQARR